jgi:SAM-dependent methyltransferase
MTQSTMEDYLAGRKLYGDDFTLPEIQQWYEDEREGYSGLRDKSRASYTYPYHSLNQLHGFRFLPRTRFKSALGLGSAYGDEFLPIVSRIDRITILDPSDAFRVANVGGVPCDYIRPSVDGLMPFEDGSFDLAVCLGVLHHIPNVTTVVKELYRCLSSGGYLLLREPIDSRGDWSKPRRYATRRERGIPQHILDAIVTGAGFQVISRHLCVCAPLPGICLRLGIHPFNRPVVTRMDAVLSRLLQRNVRYHATRLAHKFRPVSVYFVLKK